MALGIVDHPVALASEIAIQRVQGGPQLSRWRIGLALALFALKMIVGMVHDHEPVMTYGSNDTFLDNWGAVDRWVADDRITSYGPNGIGFVNFGIINDLQVNAPINLWLGCTWL